MPTIKNTFQLQTMDKETAPAFIENGRTRHAENLRFGTNGGNDGIGVNIKGTVVVSDLTDGNNDFKCVGAEYNENKNTIYYMLATTSGQISKVAEYRIDDNDDDVILHDTTSILALKKDGYITGINEIDGLLYWSEWGNNPRRANIERAKTYGTDGFTEEDIQVALIPPFRKLSLTLENTGTNNNEENNMEENFFYFSYRWKYLDGEYSILAPFTLAAFEPKNFSYDFSEQSNRSMINKFNQVRIDFNTGNERVTEIQLVFKTAQSNAEWIIDDFNKEDLGYGNDEVQSFTFNNSKAYRALSDAVIRNYSNAVPLSSKAQTIIDGRLLYGHYLENYNLIDALDQKINIDFSLELIATTNTVTVDGEEVPSLVPKKTIKSNRDVEVGLVYLDDPCRSTTILTSKTNTIYIPNENSVTENQILITLNHKPPAWAKYFRFFVKQSKKNYEQILPTLFYEDGVYRWIKLEGADKDKVQEGDYLIVKSDSQGVKQNLIRTKVLEVTAQEKNFLQPENVDDTIKERSGLYIKIKPRGFRVDQADLEAFQLETYDSSRREYNNPVRNLVPYISKAHFYGDTLDDLTSGGNYTGGNNQRHRYLIQIDGVTGGTDTFKWSDDDGANFNAENVPITGGVQTLNNGVTVQFSNTTGHSLFDEWNINARSTFSVQGDSKAYAFFRTVNNHNETIEDFQEEVIQNGARLYFKYDEYNEEDAFFELDIIANDRYDNIEEWFHKENILQEINAISTRVIAADQIHFVRGVLFYDDNATQITQNNSQGTMTMLVRSVGTQNNGADKRVKVRSNSEILQSDGETLLIFETEPKEQPLETYHEVGETYPIVNGFHRNYLLNPPYEQYQTDTQPLKVMLDWFNAYSYGNSVESYKIRDEFNAKGLDVGIRTLTTSKEEYKQVVRASDVTWSGIYQYEGQFNGLGTFNLSELNFITLDQEEGSIQLLDNDNGNLLVFQEDAIGILPYNKNVIYDTEGGRVVGVANNVLDRRSYSAYAKGRYGTKHPESFVSRGGRKYIIDQSRGKLLRLSTDGITPVSDKMFDHYFSRLMAANRNTFMVAGYDPKHGEYLFNIKNTTGIQKLQAEALPPSTYSFKEKAGGFPLVYTFDPDFMLEADNEVYAWKNGVMYKLNASETRNNFFGVQYKSLLQFFVNQEFSTEKIFTNIGLESTHPWLVKLATKLTSRDIPKECFTQIEDYWFSEIMGNTNGSSKASSSFGLGEYEIIDGVISTTTKYPSLSVGDFISSTSLLFSPNKVIEINEDNIVLETSITTAQSFLIYSKNQNVDGSDIRGDVLEIEMISDETEEVQIRAVNTEVAKSNHS